MTPSLEEWPTKAKEAPSPHEVRLVPLDISTTKYYSTLYTNYNTIIISSAKFTTNYTVFNDSSMY